MKKDEGRADSHKTSSTKSSISSHDKGLKKKKKKKKKKNGSASSVDHSVASLDKGLDKKKKKGAPREVLEGAPPDLKLRMLASTSRAERLDAAKAELERQKAELAAKASLKSALSGLSWGDEDP